MPFPSQMHLVQGNGRTPTPKAHLAPAIEKLEAGGTWEPVGSLEKTLPLLMRRGESCHLDCLGNNGCVQYRCKLLPEQFLSMAGGVHRHGT